MKTILFILLMIVSVPTLAHSTLASNTYHQLKELQLALLNYSNLEGNLPTSQNEFENLMNEKGNLLLSVYSNEDTWGQLLVYRYPSVSSIRAFDLYSIGANGVDNKGEDDDVVPWQYRGFYQPKNEFSSIFSFFLILLDGPIILIFIVIFYLSRKYKKTRNA